MTKDTVERRITAARNARRAAQAPYSVKTLPEGAQPGDAVKPQEDGFENRVFDFLTFMYTELKDDEKEKFTLFLLLLKAADEHPVKKVAERAPGIIKSQMEAIFQEYPQVIAAYKALLRGSNMVTTLAMKAMVSVAVEYKFAM